MNPDAVTVNAAGGFAGCLLPWCATQVAENELVGRERNRFADFVRCEAVGQRGGSRFRSLRGTGFKNGLAEAPDPRVVAMAAARRPIKQFVLLEQFGKKRLRLVVRIVVLP